MTLLSSPLVLRSFSVRRKYDVFRFGIVKAIEGVILDVVQDTRVKGIHRVLQRRLRDVLRQAGYHAKAERAIPFVHSNEHVQGLYDVYAASGRQSVAIEFDRARTMKRSTIDKLMQGDSDISIAIALGTSTKNGARVRGDPRADNMRLINETIEETKVLINKEWGTDSARWLRLAEKEVWLCVMHPWSFDKIDTEM